MNYLPLQPQLYNKQTITLTQEIFNKINIYIHEYHKI